MQHLQREQEIKYLERKLELLKQIKELENGTAQISNIYTPYYNPFQAPVFWLRIGEVVPLP